MKNKSPTPEEINIYISLEYGFLSRFTNSSDNFLHNCSLKKENLCVSFREKSPDNAFPHRLRQRSRKSCTLRQHRTPPCSQRYRLTLVGVNFLIQGERLYIFPIQKGYFLHAASLLVSKSFFSIKYDKKSFLKSLTIPS